MRHNIPYRNEAGGGNNPAIAGILLSPTMRSLMFERAEIAQAVYRDVVSKRSGRLARSARVETFVGGRAKDRWCGRLIIGGPEAPHGLPHEYGYDLTDDEGEVVAFVEGVHDLNQVLNMMGGL